VPPRLVLLYATCSLNRDFLSPYAPAVPYTPHLDAFQHDAVVFERHQTESAQSGVAFASIFSGAQADTHGIFSHPAFLSDDVHLVTEAYADAGWDVYAWLNHLMANGELRYAQGVPEAHAHRTPLRADDPAFLEILDRLARDPHAPPAFIVTNFTVTHGPYRGHGLREFCDAFPRECRDLPAAQQHGRLGWFYRHDHLGFSYDHARTIERLALSPADVEDLRRTLEIYYKADVHHLDALFGQVIDALAARGLLDRSVVAFTADHGEVLFRENAPFKWTHGYQLAPEELGVPLILHGPAAGVRGGRYRHVTRSIDVFPTLAGLSGLPRPPGATGENLAPVLRGRASPPELPAFSHTALLAPSLWEQMRKFAPFVARFPTNDPGTMWVAVRSGDRVVKLHHGDGGFTPAIFDLASDPAEMRDLFDPENREHREAVARLQRYKADLVAAFETPRRDGARPVGNERELLRSLGYVE
jgi:arylsulfatase A-like enzyme